MDTSSRLRAIISFRLTLRFQQRRRTLLLSQLSCIANTRAIRPPAGRAVGVIIVMQIAEQCELDSLGRPAEIVVFRTRWGSASLVHDACQRAKFEGQPQASFAEACTHSKAPSSPNWSPKPSQSPEPFRYWQGTFHRL